uniref:Uncharacterized protein n=1 Tax=Lactuca sativa TaxID=4236 RepID=A0A9R1VXD9_LACSA|nr:hypothetical protein LSAT_V11C400157050 [Lactuca sativa]
MISRLHLGNQKQRCLNSPFVKLFRSFHLPHKSSAKWIERGESFLLIHSMEALLNGIKWMVPKNYTRKENAPAHGVSETVVGVLGGGQLGRMLC